MSLRATRQFVEVLASGVGTLRATRQFVEILSKIQIITQETIEQESIFTQNLSIEVNPNVSQSLIFNQSIEVEGRLLKWLVQNFIFSSTVGYAPRPKSIEQIFNFEQEIDVRPYVTNVIQELFFDDISNLPKLKSIAQNFIFNQQTYCNHANFISDLLLTQIAGAGKIILGGIERDILQNILFEQNASKVLILVTAVPCSAENNLNFIQWAGFPKTRTLQQVYKFTQIAKPGTVRHVQQYLFWDQPRVVFISTRKPTVLDNLIFQHAFIADDVGSICTYDPILGYSSDPNAPEPPSSIPPILEHKPYVKLYWPIVSPTKIIQIRTPMLGDRDRLQNMRIQRESRGGTLQIFADPTWPKQQVLALTFTGLTEIEASILQQFFFDTLGLEIGFIDWDNRIWHGIIVTPDEPFIRARRNIVDISFEFEGELQ